MQKNPYVRLRELCGISQKAFREKYDFGKMTLVYVDAGLYPDISDRLNISLGKECVEKGVDALSLFTTEYGASSLNEAYHLWQKVERQRNRELFFVEPPFRHDAKTSPFLSYIEDTTGSSQSFCKKLKVPAASVQRYATGTTHSMPKAVEDALREIQYPYVRDLVETQAVWIQEHL